MSKKKATGAPQLTVVTNEPKAIIHVSTQVQVTYGYVENGNVVSLPPVGFTVSRALTDKGAVADFVTAYEQQRAEKHLEVNGVPAEE